MAFDNQKISYFNTLIFTIVSGVASLILLCMLFFQPFKKFIVAIVTIEIGIFIIIAWCVYKIIKNDNYLKDLMAKNKLIINFDQCGDYFVRRTTPKGEVYCSNDYVIRDEKDAPYIMKIYPAGDPDLPQTNSLDYSNPATSFYQDNRLETYKLKELADDKDLPNNTEKCKPLYQKVEKYNGYEKVPWTYARSRCDMYHTNE